MKDGKWEGDEDLCAIQQIVLSCILFYTSKPLYNMSYPHFIKCLELFAWNVYICVYVTILMYQLSIRQREKGMSVRWYTIQDETRTIQPILQLCIMSYFV